MDIPAFPVHPGVQIDAPVANFQGMTLRDYFAAAALQGICSTLNVAGEVKYTLIAEDTYKIADAMMAERSKRYATSFQQENSDDR